MPHVVVKLASGRSDQVKALLTERIVKDVMDVLQCGDGAVSLAIEDVEPQAWMERVYKPDIEPKWERLYKKPGYKP